MIITNTFENTELPRFGFTLEQLGKSVGGEETPISNSTLYREIRDGYLQVTKIGKRTIVTPEQKDAWLKRRARTTPLEEPAHLAEARRKKQASGS